MRFSATRTDTTSLIFCFSIFLASTLCPATPACSQEVAESETQAATTDESGEVWLPPLNLGYSPAVGRAHPDFVLPSIDDGAPIRLSDFRGKKVLLLHFASW